MCIGFQISNGFTNESDILVDTTTETTYTAELTSSTDYTFIVKSKDEAGNLSAVIKKLSQPNQPAATNLKSKRNYSSAVHENAQRQFSTTFVTVDKSYP
jgi:hypothetical protein